MYYHLTHLTDKEFHDIVLLASFVLNGIFVSYIAAKLYIWLLK